MKKLLYICFILIVATLSLVACNKQDSEKPEHTHSFGEWEATKNPTCTEDGAKVRYCSCGEKQSEIVVAFGHTPADATVENKVDPTYEADGSYNEVVRCATCNEKLSETSHVIPMLKHTPTDAVEENRVEATCYSEGSYDTVVYCSDCGVELERARHTIPMEKHTPASAVEENRVNPTYENDGSYQMVVYCSVIGCGAELERTTHSLDMLVHHPGNAVVENEVAATCYSTGNYDEVVYCLDADCGHKELSRKTITVSMIAHTSADAVVENLVNATCTTDGSYDEVVYCSVENCKVQISRTKKVIDALGHSFANGSCAVCGEDQPESEGLIFTSNGDGTCSVSDIGTCKDTDIRIPKVSPAGETVTKIEQEAFYGCTAITSITLPDTITSIGRSAFYNTGYYKNANNWENGALYIGNCLIKADSDATGVFYIKDGTVTIAGGAFNSCDFTDIIIPNTVKHIGNESFGHCNNITSLVLPDGLLTIDDWAFYRSESLKYVYIPDSVTSIGMRAFHSCSALESIKIPDSVTGSIDTCTFYGCTSLKSVFIGSGINSIGQSAFVGCSNLTAVILGNNVTSIGTSAFYGCAKLISIVIPDSVISIGDSAFFDCDFLANVYFSNSVKSIGNKAFATGYSSKINVYYSGTAEEWATLGIDISNNYGLYEANKHFNYSPVKYYSYTQTLAIPTGGSGTCSVTDIAGTISKNIVIPCVTDEGEIVTSIGFYAFESSQIKTIVIPHTITKIGERAFESCNQLTDVYFTGTEEEWNNIVIEKGNEQLTGATIHYNYVPEE